MSTPSAQGKATSQKKLKQKAMRSYCSLKKMIDFKRLKKNILFKLFGTLIQPQPVVSYMDVNCKAWLPETWYVKYMTGQTRTNSLQNRVKDPLKVLHLTFLKWTLGVNRKTSNAAVWGDCGKYPLALELTKKYSVTMSACRNQSSKGETALLDMHKVSNAI